MHLGHDVKTATNLAVFKIIQLGLQAADSRRDGALVGLGCLQRLHGRHQRALHCALQWHQCRPERLAHRGQLRGDGANAPLQSAQIRPQVARLPTIQKKKN